LLSLLLILQPPLLTLFPYTTLFRSYFNLGDGRIVLTAVRRALGDPAAQQSVFIRVGVHPHAAAVGDAVGGLHQEQAALRGGGEQPSAAGFLDQELVILLRIKAQQRELEAILARRLAVTAA